MKNIYDPLKEHRALLSSLSDPYREQRELIASITNPLKEYQALFSGINDPLREYRELAASITNPLKETQSLLAGINDPLSEYRELAASITNPLKETQSLLAGINDPFSEYHELAVSITNPLKETQSLLAGINDPLREYRELAASITNPLNETQSLLAGINDPLSKYRESLGLFETPLKELSTLVFGNVPLDLNKKTKSKATKKKVAKKKTVKAKTADLDTRLQVGEIESIGSEQATLHEFQVLTGQVIHEAAQKSSSSLEESINNLVAVIQSKEKDSARQKILSWLIYCLLTTIIAALMNPVADHYIKEHLKNDKRVLSKQIKQDVKSSVSDQSVLSSLRYVSADILNVRNSASNKSEKIGFLRFGNTVVVLEKQKNWTLVEWNDSENEVRITGWVFSRYLAKFT